MRYLKNSHRSLRVLLTLVAALLLVGAFSAQPGSAAGEKRTKESSSRHTSEQVACNDARESAKKLAELDCMTGAGVLTKESIGNCNCQPMGGKWLCSASVTYECE
jgi:hypothetical protein